MTWFHLLLSCTLCRCYYFFLIFVVSKFHFFCVHNSLFLFPFFDVNLITLCFFPLACFCAERKYAEVRSSCIFSLKSEFEFSLFLFVVCVKWSNQWTHLFTVFIILAKEIFSHFLLCGVCECECDCQCLPTTVRQHFQSNLLVKFNLMTFYLVDLLDEQVQW